MAPSTPSPSSSSAPTTSVQVAVRIRPTTTQDTTSIPARFQRAVVHSVSNTTVSIDAFSAAPASAGASSASAAPPSSGPSNKKQLFTFDQVHDPSTTQHAMFTSTAQPLISRFVDGFNCTILAYGQTSSGKTFTMTGIDLDADPSDPYNGMGIIPRAVSTIFQRARSLKEERGPTWNFSIKGSFIEIYNEDLLDLLSMDETNGGRREVQIREDKDGHIIWSGLREVTVKSANEVMSLIRQGAAIRRTNETDMNAQSSRSHAIFSLTLTQKKYTGSGPPPRSSSPLPPTGRSPSRLARPGSLYTAPRVSSPTFGRPGTPSFTSAIDRGGLRPPSSLGHRASSEGVGEEQGQWVTIVSKFHFVDLAGSERLKRTSAAGDRIKEGISINSGLLALGNVISALGDPARAKTNTASHIPYRDSKLTRLLQDSLGGNAHTLMIACVSPAEWNAGETVNTLKYANRARNIKNRAVINEKEEGWDDVEWLQTTVTRLRKELKVIKETGGKFIGGPGEVSEVPEGASKKVLEQMVQLQTNYEDLREKFVERTEELTRLRRDLSEKQRYSSTGAVSGTAKYEEIVGPVIEEYEKTIGAMEAELSLNRAALRHTNDLYEEKEAELTEISEKGARTEMYVEELKMRVAKLTEREASTEAYVRDLEEKIKNYDESTLSSSESIGDLKRELSRFKDAESHATQYIADLEARLARSDESVHSLQQTVNELEQESERRQQEIQVLQSRLESLKNDGEAWRIDLEEREKKVKELELKMQEWEAKRQEAGEERTRLGNVVNEVAKARHSLEVDLASAPTFTASEQPAVPSPSNENSVAEAQLAALQKTHATTLSDLSSVTSKYRDALREISDLASQIQEAKLSSSTPADSRSESPERTVEIPPFRRRMTGGSRSRETNEPQFNSAGRRLFFRHAASTESLHTRSLSQSQSLSQELSSAQLRKASFSSHGTSSSISHSPPGSARPSLSISLSQNGGISPGGNERSVSSLEKEIMRLQEVLKERESEIAALEISLQAKDRADVLELSMPSTPIANGDGHFSGASTPDVHLSPKTMNQFKEIRRSFEHDVAIHENGSAVSDSDESLVRLNELMMAMAQKESQHRETVDGLNDQLGQLRRQHDELTTLSRDQALNMSTELDALHKRHHEGLADLELTQQREAELLAAIQQAETSHAAEIDQLRFDHEEVLRAKEAEVSDLIARMKDEHESSLKSIRAELAEASAALEKAHQDHKEAFGKLQSDHEAELQRHIDEAAALLESTRKEHETLISKLNSERDEALKQKEEEAAANLASTEEQYYNALTKLRIDHAQALEKQAADAAAALDRLREDHASALRQVDLTYRGTLNETESSKDVAMKALQDEYASSIARKEAAFAEDVEKLKAEHAQRLARQEEDFNSRFQRTLSEHSATLAKLQEESKQQVETLSIGLSSNQEALSAASASAKAEMAAALQNLREQQALILEEIAKGHEEELAKTNGAHQSALADVEAKMEQERFTILQSHSEEIAKLHAEHHQAMAEINSSLIAAQEQHHQDLETACAQSEQLLADEKSRMESILAEMGRSHAQERDILLKDHDLIADELAAQRAESDELTLAREQSQIAHEQALAEKDDIVTELQGRLSNSEAARADLGEEVRRLRQELDSTRKEQSKLVQEASKRQSLVDELEKHRSELAEMQENLQRARDEKDSLQMEKNRQDTLVKELQALLARSPSPPGSQRNAAYNRVNGIPTAKLPPPTPPPTMPPPPTPSHKASLSLVERASSQSSSAATFSSSRESTVDSPATSVAHSLVNGGPSADPHVLAKLEEQSKFIDEQEAMIKTLNKQLTHCESDLQNHMEMVGKMESQLGDSEKNLRKARMHATELARERDALSSQLDSVRAELVEAKREVVNVRRSVVEEKQSLESRLDEERRAKERARAQLDSRMEELQRRKSKFACL
ncbi:hypothetical protein JAAARDRAFT_32135 [Jaapia argillacea MUCL 33604]|uniref:Kinesin motor domain-containing protein n=1 Tax=Jaapia argillacea MUCL 33604 TaxID=933084 RepID=A0A067Q4N2_9AGAM|nr:hypothetical protein JAAARDRAFT_32135 [Jaapia argillacea MUCL 33604]